MRIVFQRLSNVAVLALLLAASALVMYYMSANKQTSVQASATCVEPSQPYEPHDGRFEASFCSGDQLVVYSEQFVLGLAAPSESISFESPSVHGKQGELVVFTVNGNNWRQNLLNSPTGATGLTDLRRADLNKARLMVQHKWPEELKLAEDYAMAGPPPVVPEPIAPR